MKFTEEEFSEKLKSELTGNGKKPMQMSERTFKKLVGKIYKRIEKYDGEAELSDAVADNLEDLTEIEGNYNKDRADFVKDWKEKHPEPKGTKSGSKETEEPEEDQIAILTREIREIKEAQARRERKEAAERKRKEIKTALKKDGVDDAEWIDGYLSKITITDETDIEEEKADALKLYNRQESATGNLTPGRAGGGGDTPDLSYLGI